MPAVARWAVRRNIALAGSLLVAIVAVLAAASWLATRVWSPALARERLEAGLGEVLARPARIARVSVGPRLLQPEADAVA